MITLKVLVLAITTATGAVEVDVGIIPFDSKEQCLERGKDVRDTFSAAVPSKEFHVICMDEDVDHVEVLQDILEANKAITL